jgi:hypothetical protein
MAIAPKQEPSFAPALHAPVAWWWAKRQTFGGPAVDTHTISRSHACRTDSTGFVAEFRVPSPCSLKLDREYIPHTGAESEASVLFQDQWESMLDGTVISDGRS